MFCTTQLTDRTRADVQGGILTDYEGKPKLVEAVQVPPEHLHEFHLLKKFNLFNTNNLWVSLRAVQVPSGGWYPCRAPFPTFVNCAADLCGDSLPNRAPLIEADCVERDSVSRDCEHADASGAENVATGNCSWRGH